METLTHQKNNVRKTDFRLIEIDESNAWREDILKACGGRITTVYLFDASLTTCLCEYTPSYFLTPLYCITEKAFDEIDAKMQDEFQTGEMLNEPIYMHCNQVNKISIKPDVNGLNGKFTALDGRKYKELFDNAFEYLSGNHQIYKK